MPDFHVRTAYGLLISFHGQLICSGRDDGRFYLSDCLQTKTGIYLMQEGNEEPFNIRLHLAKDILTIQEQDVICVSGEPFYSSVSSSETAPPSRCLYQLICPS